MENESTSSPSLRRDMGKANSVCQTHFAHNFRQPTIESRSFSDNCIRDWKTSQLQTNYNVSSDTNDEEALARNHFLLRRPYSSFAPLSSTSRTFSKKECSCTQTLLDHFWQRLQKDYTSDLISRPRWRKESKQLKEGDLVWLLHEFTPRGIWPMCRIAKCHNGLDGPARSFEIKTSTGVLNRRAVKLAKFYTILETIKVWISNNILVFIFR